MKFELWERDEKIFGRVGSFVNHEFTTICIHSRFFHFRPHWFLKIEMSLFFCVAQRAFGWNQVNRYQKHRVLVPDKRFFIFPLVYENLDENIKPRCPKEF